MLFCGTARRCTKQCLQPFFCIFVQCLVYLFIIFYFLYLFIILYFLYLFIIFFIFVHYFLFYSIYLSIFYICLYYELLVVASSNACNRLWTYLLNFFIIFYICSLSFIFACIWNCWTLHPATPAADCGWLLGQLIFGAQAFVPPLFLLFVLVISNIAVHIGNVALEWKCSKTSAPLNSSFFCGRLLLYKRTPMAYCKRGQTAVSRYYAIHNIGGAAQSCSDSGHNCAAEACTVLAHWTCS